MSRLCLCVAIIVGLSLPAAAPGRVIDAPTQSAKKRCKVVVKKIHGKRKRVRVCHTVKPPPPPPPKAATVVGSLEVGAGSGASIMSIAVGDGAVWLTLSDGATILRVNPGTLQVVARLTNPLPAEWPPVVGIGFGSAWIANPIPAIDDDPVGGALVRIDQKSNQVAGTIPVGRSPDGLAFAAGSVWTANHRSDDSYGAPAPHTFTLSRVDPATGTEVARIPVERRADRFDDWENFCCGPSHLTATAGSVWVGDAGNATVYRVDTSTNSVTAAIHAPSGAEACGNLASEGGRIWVASSCDSNAVWSIDPATNDVARSVTLPSGAFFLVGGLGSLWAGTPGIAGTQGLLLRLDSATGKIRGRTPVAEMGPVAVGEGAVWVAKGSKLLKLRPA